MGGVGRFLVVSTHIDIQSIKLDKTYIVFGISQYGPSLSNDTLREFQSICQVSMNPEKCTCSEDFDSIPFTRSNSTTRVFYHHSTVQSLARQVHFDREFHILHSIPIVVSSITHHGPQAS
jgi:hypothetical protein